jgi:hypothetical protein
MSKYLINKFPAPFDIARKPRVHIFQLASTKEPRSWYVRIRKEGGGYFQTTLNCYERIDAIREADKVWREFQTASEKGVVYGKLTFKKLWAKWRRKNHLGDFRAERVDWLYKRYFSWFDKYEVGNINNKVWEKYLIWRVNFWSNVPESERPYHTKPMPSFNTLKSERQVLIQVLRWAAQDDLVLRVPRLTDEFKKFARVNNVEINFKKTRGVAIDERMVKVLLGKLHHWAFNEKQHPNWVRNFARLRLYYFILICNNSMIRLGTEATGLKWKDLNIIKSKKFDNTKIGYFEVHQGKKSHRYEAGETQIAILSYNGLEPTLKWREISESFGFGKDDDYIFPNHDGEQIPTHYMTRTFHRLLKKWKMSHDKNGVAITLYSWRHTKIVRMLVHSKKSPAEVAKMANTSLLSISRAYFNTEMIADADKYAQHSENTDELKYLTDEKKENINELVKRFGY